ncbi:MAG: phosphotransferase, partial [Actinoplanes sp.]
APHPTDLYLDHDGPGFCQHKPLAEHSRRSARLLDHIHAVAADGTAMIGDDLVHFDFHPGNVLVHQGTLTGVIDWDGATRGDRHFDLVTLRFTRTAQTPDLLGELDERLSVISDRRRRAYWAHMSLRQVDWSIRHHDPATVEHWLTVAESGLNL